MVTSIQRLLFTILLNFFSTFVYSQKELQYEDKTYEPQIKTVQCYNSDSNKTYSPTVALLSNQSLVIEFDDLSDQSSDLYVKLLPCNFDWSPSNLKDLEFLNEYNEFFINDFAFSINTQIPYIHYRFPIPKVKVPGNYLIMIYRDGNKTDLILSKRLMIYDLKTTLIPDYQLQGIGNVNTDRQILNFSINHGAVQIINPSANLHVVIRQNQRWESAKFDIQPSAIVGFKSILEFKNYDPSNAFFGGNEFRFVDLTSINAPGQNVNSVYSNFVPVKITVALDAPRTHQAYSLEPDINGNFTITNNDYNDQSWISSDYLDVEFTLKSELITDKIFVVGAFNGWEIKKECQMRYDPSLKKYSTTILLKQGYYNYQYLVNSSSKGGNYIEGNHFQTENEYEVMVYYSSFQPFSDLLIGYFTLQTNN